MPTKQAISQIVNQYREELGGGAPLSFRKFAAQLNEGLDETVTFQTLANWAQARYEPDTGYLVAYLLPCTGWRSDFARDLLSVLKQDVYQPATDIGREAHENL